MSSLISWVVVVSLLFGIAGGLYWQSWRGFSIGLVFGIMFSAVTWIRNIAAILFPDSFVTYASDVTSPAREKQETNSTIIALAIPDIGTRQLRGLTQDEWRHLAHGVIERGYRYTTRDLQDIFGPQEGNRIYGRVTQQLLDAGVLVPSGSNGVAITEHVGKHFFDQLDKQDYKVIELIPRPTPESP